MNMNRYEGKVALVTGAASGIGLATAERLAREGARVLACDINAALLTKEIDRLAGEGLAVVAQVANVAERVSARAAVDAVIARFGRLDVLGNIAGVLTTGHFADLGEAEWARALGVNVTGVVNFCLAALPRLVESRGNIVNVSSVAGLVGVPYAVAYSATKGAVLALSRSLAGEYASRGVRVNAVCPGHVRTPMTAGSAPPQGADLSLYSRLPPLVLPPAAPAEIAAVIAYAGSDEARFVTGAHFTIDGGQSAI